MPLPVLRTSATDELIGLVVVLALTPDVVALPVVTWPLLLAPSRMSESSRAVVATTLDVEGCVVLVHVEFATAKVQFCAICAVGAVLMARVVLIDTVLGKVNRLVLLLLLALTVTVVVVFMRVASTSSPLALSPPSPPGPRTVDVAVLASEDVTVVEVLLWHVVVEALLKRSIVAASATPDVVAMLVVGSLVVVDVATSVGPQELWIRVRDTPTPSIRTELLSSASALSRTDDRFRRWSSTAEAKASLSMSSASRAASPLALLLPSPPAGRRMRNGTNMLRLLSEISPSSSCICKRRQR